MTWWPLLLIICGTVMLLIEGEEHPLIGAVVESRVPARPLVRNEERSHGF